VAQLTGLGNSWHRPHRAGVLSGGPENGNAEFDKLGDLTSRARLETRIGQV
jgi:hypothetical protein